ncbi:M23 family metallopeptidase [Dysgonomonas sp. 520]|uniref:M23 family metallopeptidase n=1 Tax=Dysgonomonas sp. 520 TaxID=2302931 RepID=UPI0013D2DB58|nr:M23 family metallopeptidase [Dysgonomonas sp. 520]NDW10890.1 LysM peptidoglycan-binding domain-containing protein [Dysgonomonas sp. 520]
MANLKKIKTLSLAVALAFPLCSLAQNQTENTSKEERRAEVSFSQRHSRPTANNLYADGIKIKKDLSLVDKAQEERLLNQDEIPADDLYGNIWSSSYVNAYRNLEVVPDTFTVDLSNFTMPTMGHVTSNFGPRRRRMHYGVDLKVQVGDTIYAAFDGKVRICHYERRGYGYYVVLRHTNGLETVYGHLSEFLVSENDVVKSGDPIALGGNTGRSTGPHLHLETRFLGKPINPAEIIDFSNKICYKDTYKVRTESFAYASSSRNAAYASSKTTKKGANKYSSGSVKYHRIKQGDTLGAIARRYGTSVSKLCSLNKIGATSTLKLGKSIRVS